MGKPEDMEQRERRSGATFFLPQLPQIRHRPMRPALAALVALALPALSVAQLRDTTIINRSANPLLSEFRFRSIGPASMGGRVDDIEDAPSNPSVIYVRFAVGGGFKSVNNGTTFEPVFERYGSASIGDIAIDPTNPDIVYVGTGEPNNRQTSSRSEER